MFHFRSPFRRRILLVLLTLCLSTWAAALVEATNARYVTRTSGSVRVASFLVETGEPVLQSADGIIDCNVPEDRVDFSLSIRNRSEVVVEYQVRIEGLPDPIAAEILNGNGILSANGGETAVTLSLFAKDPADRNVDLSAGNMIVYVTAAQKGGGNE